MLITWSSTVAVVSACIGLVLVQLPATFLARTPWWSRWAGVMTVVGVIACLVALISAWLGGPWVWSWWHGLLGAAVVATEFAVAAQWPVVLFRAAIVTLAVGCVLVVLVIGREAMAQDDLTRIRAEITELYEAGGDALDGEVVELCVAAQGVLQTAPPTCTVHRDRAEGPTSAIGDAANAVQLRASLAVQIAENDAAEPVDPAFSAARAEQETQRREDAVVAARLENARVGALTGFARAAPVDVLTALARGGTSLLGAGPWTPWTATVPVWIVAGALLVLLLRRLEIVNGYLDAGPVEFEASEKVPETLLRRTVLLNLTEPGLQPGSQADFSVTDLASTELVGGALGALAKMVRAVGVPRRGYRVTLVGPSSQGAAGPQLIVTVQSRRTGRTVATLTSDRPGVDEAVVHLGFQAAAVVLGRARGIPPWMRWPHDSASALRVADHRRAVDKLVRVPEQAVDDVRFAPGNAVLLVDLGYELTLAGTTVEAARAFERAHRLWPDYELAGYRLAIHLATTAPRERGAAAAAIFTRVIGDLSIPTFGLRKLSLRERSSVASWRERRTLRTLVQLAAEVLNHRRYENCGLDRRLVRRAARTRSALVQYNLACLLCAAGEPGEAETALRTALTCPDVGRISPVWLRKDPDLAAVRSCVGFRELQDALPATPTTRRETTWLQKRRTAAHPFRPRPPVIG